MNPVQVLYGACWGALVTGAVVLSFEAALIRSQKDMGVYFEVTRKATLETETPAHDSFSFSDKTGKRKMGFCVEELVSVSTDVYTVKGSVCYNRGFTRFDAAVHATIVDERISGNATSLDHYCATIGRGDGICTLDIASYCQIMPEDTFCQNREARRRLSQALGVGCDEANCADEFNVSPSQSGNDQNR